MAYEGETTDHGEIRSWAGDALAGAQTEVGIPIQGAELQATLAVPDFCEGMIVFAHGSGSGRGSPRNRFVARELIEAGFGVLLLDLLTVDEERLDRETRDLRFDIDRLALRLVRAIDWLGEHQAAGSLPIGCYGASTGAAAALVAAADRPERVRAVVSRGGRPDLAGPALAKVEAPTLLIVGGADEMVRDLNEQAAEALKAPTKIEVVAGAGHLFEEPGALERVAESSAAWFRSELVGGAVSEA